MEHVVFSGFGVSPVPKQLKEKIEKQKTINDNYQKQVEELQKELINLQSNMLAMGEKELYCSCYLIN